MRISVLVLLCVSATLAFGQQTPQNAPQPGPSVGPKTASPAKAHKRRQAVKPVALAPMPERPPDPPPPDWPANHPANPPSVDWNGRVLKVAATNSSLQQILTDVSTATGVKLEGSTGDQRVYGTYGPGSAREVIGQLLDGSDYNVLMIGDQGEGTPRRLVLTSKTAHGAAPRPAVVNSEPAQGADDQPEEQPELPEQPPPMQQGPQNRTPQEIQQELMQRQQQMQQQQQQAQPGQTPNQGL
jgi:hypothetical protein